MADAPLRQDIQDAADRLKSRFGARREIGHLIRYLQPGETVSHLAGGSYGDGLGLLALTNLRLLFVRDGWVNKASEDFPLAKVSSVQWTSGFATGRLIIYASGNRAEIRQVYKDDGVVIADAIRSRLSATTEPSDAGSDIKPPDSPIEALRQLGELRDAGIITAEEFEAKKTELLRRI